MRRFFVIAVALLVSIGLEAKGTTVKLTVTGPGLAAPVEIVERAILDQSNVWEGSFIGETLEATPPASPPRYTMTFDVELPAWQRAGVKRMYTVSVARDARSGGLVFCPDAATLATVSTRARCSATRRMAAGTARRRRGHRRSRSIFREP